MLPLNALTVRFMEGSRAVLKTDWVHRKTVPYFIAAQVLRGAYELSCDGRRGRAEVGDVFLTRPDTPVAIRHCGLPPDPASMEARWLHVSYRLHAVVDVGALLDTPLVLRGERAAAIGALIAEALATDADAEDGDDLARLGRRLAVAYRLFDHITAVATPRPDAARLLNCPDRLLAVFRHMDAHLAEPQTVADLARVAGLSRSRFLHTFKDHTGLSPMAYLRRQRLRRAQDLLIHGDAPVGRIAAQLGFANVFHFSRSFKAHTGVSPLRFRQTHPPLGPLLAP